MPRSRQAQLNNLAEPEAPLTSEAADKELAAVVAPAARTFSDAFTVMRLASAAVMTLAGAWIVLAGPVTAAICALNIAAAPVLWAVTRRRAQAKLGTRWTAAAEVHAYSLPHRVPAATLTAAHRYLRILADAHHKVRVWLYVAPCPGPDAKCTVLCQSAATWTPGGQIMVILGEHPAQSPPIAAVALAHETCHQAGAASRVLKVIHHARTYVGWGYSAAGLAGALVGGWPAVLAFALAFHVLSLQILWSVEIACDLHAARNEGLPAALAGYHYMTTQITERRARSTTPRVRRAISAILYWAAGPLHPPVKVRRKLTSALSTSTTHSGR